MESGGFTLRMKLPRAYKYYAENGTSLPLGNTRSRVLPTTSTFLTILKLLTDFIPTVFRFKSVTIPLDNMTVDWDLNLKGMTERYHRFYWQL